jgi:hypothetical protein
MDDELHKVRITADQTAGTTVALDGRDISKEITGASSCEQSVPQLQQPVAHGRERPETPCHPSCPSRCPRTALPPRP